MKLSSSIIVGLFAAMLLTIVAVSLSIAGHRQEIVRIARRFNSQPSVESLRRRYQREINFLVRRFSTEEAFGLSFTLGLTALVISTLLFGKILGDVLDRNEIARFDEPIVSFIVENRIAWLTFAMKAVTQLGRTEFVIVVMAAAGFYFHRQTGRWRHMLLLQSEIGRASCRGRVLLSVL